MGNNVNGPTLHSFSILQKTSNLVNSLLQEMSTNDAGYLTFSQIIEQIQLDIEDARERAKTETIRVGILGGRGSGKSTLANAIIGEYILPESAIVFCTSIPTTIKYGKSYKLDIDSNISSNILKNEVDKVEQLQDALNGICKESENPNNIKQITKITIEIPQRILDGKEIVDVPGFTRGNALHQAFAEKYAKYYCDLCLVLVNNSESVDINGEGGIPALCSAFKDRIESTVFIINKADQSSKGDITYIKNQIHKSLDGKDLMIFVVSSKNALSSNNNDDSYDFNALWRHLSYLSEKKIVFLVLSLLQRLVSNFKTLQELCHLNGSTLDEIQKNLKALSTTDFKRAEKILLNNMSTDSTLPKKIKELDISQFKIPPYITAIGAYDYAKQIVDSFETKGKDVLSEHIQEQQAELFKVFSTKFEEEVAKFDNTMRDKIKEFESQFRIATSIAVPSVSKNFNVSAFNPNKIEKLKPSSFRLWTEKTLPSILVRDIVFWESPVSLSLLGVGFTVSLPVPVGLKKKSDTLEDVAQNVPQKAVEIMNEYILESLSRFAREMSLAYTNALTVYINEWEKCLRDYDKRIQLARNLTEPASISKIETITKTLNSLLLEINGLIIYK